MGDCEIRVPTICLVERIWQVVSLDDNPCERKSVMIRLVQMQTHHRVIQAWPIRVGYPS
jgi:hypothetical protein